jgi:hypothetical protein
LTETILLTPRNLTALTTARRAISVEEQWTHIRGDWWLHRVFDD